MRGRRRAATLADQADASLLDLIDNALNRGVVIEGEVVLGLADVDLIDVRLSILLAAVGRLRRAAARPAGASRNRRGPSRT